MTKRNLATIDTDIGQDWSRLIKEAFADGLDCDFITEGGKTSTGIDQGLMTVSLAKNFELGTRRAHDGKVFRYAKCDTGTAIVAGDLIQSAANGGNTTAEVDCTIGTASTAGASVGYATVKSTGLTVADTYKDGYYVVSDGTAAQGCGQMKKISSHTGATASGVSVKFTFTDALEVLISTSAKAGVIKSLYDDVIEAPVTTPTGVTVGVAPVAVPVTTPYFWLQTWGICPVLVKTATSAGKQILRDVGAAGSVGIQTATTGAANIVTEVIGQSGWTTSTGDNGFVYLTIAP